MKKMRSVLRKINRGKILIVLVVMVILIAALVAAANIYVLKSTGSRMLTPERADVSKTAIIVLGARVYENGDPSNQLEDRLIVASELYKNGFGRKVLVSGDHGRTTYDEVNAMRDYLLSRGVRSSDIFLDHAGFRTYDTMVRAKKVFLVNDAYVVTQRYHLPRSVFLARRAGIDAHGVIADRRRYRNRVRDNIREILARAWAVIDCVIGREPKFLGQVIPIEGSPEKSYDRTTRGNSLQL
jgi:SanA protein